LKRRWFRFLISDGDSALLELPIDSAITLDDLQAVNRALVCCGAVVSEMNVALRFLLARHACGKAPRRQATAYSVYGRTCGGWKPSLISPLRMPASSKRSAIRRSALSA
jgi:hypothetical protein